MVVVMEGAQARSYFICYKALVGASFVQATGAERAFALMRAWSYYARPLIDVLWDEEANPVAREVAHQLVGWLLWFQDLDDPENFFRDILAREESRKAMVRLHT
jgi:hypothetical protein